MSDESSVIVIGPDGQPVQLPNAASAEGADNPITQMMPEPDKVLRIGTMVKQLLEEVRQAPLDDASRKRLMEIHDRSITQLAEGLSPDLREELEAFTLPFSGDEVPSNDELRIAQAQLVGWLEGVFHGIQTALVAQQVAARAQIEQMRGRSLPAGLRQQPQQPGAGQYL